MWVRFNWPGNTEDFPFYLPDGSDFEEEIRRRGLAAVPSDAWLEPWNFGKTVDWLWFDSFFPPIVSQRLLDALQSFDQPSLHARPITIRRKRSADIEGYSLIEVPLTHENLPIRRVREYPHILATLDVSENVAHMLKELKLTGFKISKEI